MSDWTPHELGAELEVFRLDDPSRSSLKARRRVRAKVTQARSIQNWPAERRVLLVEWLKRSKSESPRWQDLLKWANPRVQLAVDTLQGLLLSGWVEVEEIKNQQTRGVWQPMFVTWRSLDDLRGELGLIDPEAQRQQREAARIFRADDERLVSLEMALAQVPAQVVMARRQLADALCDWLRLERSGTRRHFAQAARGLTKGITTAEWAWLASTVDLATCGISEHQPLVCLGGTGQLLRGELCLCDLAALTGYLALTPDNLLATTGLSKVERLCVIENLTSFESQVAKRIPGEMVIWLPGYAAVWWLDAFAALVRLISGEVWIACDCDPWGIELAMRTAQMVELQGKTWRAWMMDADTLRTCKTLIPLTEADRRKLYQLLAAELPPILRELAQAQHDLSAKAEQEQYL